MSLHLKFMVRWMDTIVAVDRSNISPSLNTSGPRVSLCTTSSLYPYFEQTKYHEGWWRLDSVVASCRALSRK